MNIRNLLLYVLTLAYFFCFSCKNEEKIKIGYLQPNLQTNRYKKEREYFIEKVKELGGEALTASAEYDDQLQLQQARDLIALGIKVLVVNAVNSNTAADIVRHAQAAGVEVIAYDRLIKNCNLNYYVTFDSKRAGRLMAGYMVNQQPTGKYILLGGDKSDLNAVMVKDGQMEVLEPYIKSGQIQIVYSTFIESWSGENAKHEIERFLDLSEIKPDVIISSNDVMAIAVAALLKEYHLNGQVLLTGQDALPEACHNIMNGNQTITIYKSFKTLTYRAVDIAMKLAKHEKVQSFDSSIFNGLKKVPSILIEPTVVDKNNLKNTVPDDVL